MPSRCSLARAPLRVSRSGAPASAKTTSPSRSGRGERPEESDRCRILVDRPEPRHHGGGAREDEHPPHGRRPTRLPHRPVLARHIRPHLGGEGRQPVAELAVAAVEIDRGARLGAAEDRRDGDRVVAVEVGRVDELETVALVAPGLLATIHEAGGARHDELHELRGQTLLAATEKGRGLHHPELGVGLVLRDHDAASLRVAEHPDPQPGHHDRARHDESEQHPGQDAHDPRVGGEGRGGEGALLERDRPGERSRTGRGRRRSSRSRRPSARRRRRSCRRSRRRNRRWRRSPHPAAPRRGAASRSPTRTAAPSRRR